MGARRDAAVTPQAVAHGWRSGLPLRSAPSSSTRSGSPDRSACRSQVTGPPASSQQARGLPRLGVQHDVIAPIGAAVDAKQRLLGRSASPQPYAPTGERASERTR
jgi:hypothetical protein